MQANELTSNLINDLGSKLGIDGLQFDSSGDCFFAVDEMPVAIQVRNDRWQLAGFIAELAEGEDNDELTYSAAQWRSLLEINHTLAMEGYNASLSYDRDAECVLFIQPLQESHLDAGQIAGLLETFVHRMEEIRSVVDQVREDFRSESLGESAEELPTSLDQYV